MPAYCADRCTHYSYYSTFAGGVVQETAPSGVCFLVWGRQENSSFLWLLVANTCWLFLCFPSLRTDRVPDVRGPALEKSERGRCHLSSALPGACHPSLYDHSRGHPLPPLWRADVIPPCPCGGINKHYTCTTYPRPATYQIVLVPQPQSLTSKHHAPGDSPPFPWPSRALSAGGNVHNFERRATGTHAGIRMPRGPFNAEKAPVLLHQHHAPVTARRAHSIATRSDAWGRGVRGWPSHGRGGGFANPEAVAIACGAPTPRLYPTIPRHVRRHLLPGRRWPAHRRLEQL